MEDSDGDEDARREVQAVLGENMDVDELIDSDSDNLSSHSSSSDSSTPDRDDHLDITTSSSLARYVASSICH